MLKLILIFKVYIKGYVLSLKFEDMRIWYTLSLNHTF
jgi:hypothetical protein